MSVCKRRFWDWWIKPEGTLSAGGAISDGMLIALRFGFLYLTGIALLMTVMSLGSSGAALAMGLIVFLWGTFFGVLPALVLGAVTGGVLYAVLCFAARFVNGAGASWIGTGLGIAVSCAVFGMTGRSLQTDMAFWLILFVPALIYTALCSLTAYRFFCLLELNR